MLIAHVTGFPFHLPADEQEGTIHLIGRDSTAKNAALSPQYFYQAGKGGMHRASIAAVDAAFTQHSHGQACMFNFHNAIFVLVVACFPASFLQNGHS